jgi:hypothetical protein
MLLMMPVMTSKSFDTTPLIMDKEAVALFITDTAFAYAFELAGAILGLLILLIVVLSVKNHFSRRLNRE